ELLGAEKEVTSAQPPLRQIPIRIDPPVAQERPVAADLFHLARLARGPDDFLAVVPPLGEKCAEGIADERRAPEIEPTAFGAFMANAVDGSHVDAVGDGVRALARL